MAESKKRFRIPVNRGRAQMADAPPEEDAPAAAIDWQDRALRLQAEMENFRKRQERLAVEREGAVKATLLTQFLPVLDALEMALVHLRPDDPYDQNLKVAAAELARVLRNAGVEAIPALGEVFDPRWHEAVAVTSAPLEQPAEMVVVEQEQQGYRLGERLLRPARVVVAKKS